MKACSRFQFPVRLRNSFAQSSTSGTSPFTQHLRGLSTLRRVAQLGLNDDQIAFHQLALDFMESEMKPKAKHWDRHKICDRSVLKKAGELFGGLYIPEAHGGTGLTRHDSTLVFEALSQACVGTTALITVSNMTAWMLSTFGSQQLRDHYLPDLMSATKMGSYCLTEPQCGSDATALKTSAVRHGDEYVINGSKMFISGGGFNDVYFVMARTGEHRTGGITCVLVPTDTAGLSWSENSELKMGWHSSPTREIYFADVRVPVSNRVGNEGEGFKIAMRAIDGGRLNIAACSIGAAQRCLEEALQYSGQRKAFGKRVFDFQNTGFSLADAFGKLQSSRTLLRQAATALDEDHSDKTLMCAMAKQRVTDQCFDVCNAMLQVFGGYGYLHDYEVERFVRDARVHQILEGTNEIMKLVVSRAMQTDID